MRNPHYSVPGTRGVYAICCPKTGAVRYIGSSNNIEARFVCHRNGRSSTGNRAARRQWVLALREEGLTPVLRILQAIPQGPMAEIEGDFIGRYQLVGEADLNVAVKVGARDTMRALKEENARLRAECEKLRKECESLRAIYADSQTMQIRD